VGRRVIQHKAKPSAVLGTHTRVLFFILHKCGGALTGLKHFWSTNSLFWLLLVIQNVMHSAVFSIRSAVFAEEC